MLILDEPTRGIDIGAKAELHALIARLAEEGVAILMISSERPEILGMSLRDLVMRGRRIVADIPCAEATKEAIVAAATGQTLAALLPSPCAQGEGLGVRVSRQHRGSDHLKPGSCDRLQTNDEAVGNSPPPRLLLRSRSS